jgi:hypothetical protein
MIAMPGNQSHRYFLMCLVVLCGAFQSYTKYFAHGFQEGAYITRQKHLPLLWSEKHGVPRPVKRLTLRGGSSVRDDMSGHCRTSVTQLDEEADDETGERHHTSFYHSIPFLSLSILHHASTTAATTIEHIQAGSHDQSKPSK